MPHLHGEGFSNGVSTAQCCSVMAIVQFSFITQEASENLDVISSAFSAELVLARIHYVI